MNCNTTHYRANSSSVPGDPTAAAPGGEAASRELAALYERNGFTVHPLAHSNFVLTKFSIPSVLNAEAWPERGRARLFEKWAAEGRALHAYHSSYLDLSRRPGAPARKSYVYRPTAVGLVRPLGAPWTDRFRLLAHAFFGNPKKLSMKHAYDRLVPSRPGPYDTGSLTVDALLSELERDVRSARRGGAFVAHLMSPHHAYCLAADGSLLPLGEWESPRTHGPAERERAYPRYLDQMRWVNGRLERFFEFLRREGLYDEAAIVVVGDHGSRLAANFPGEAPADELGRADYLDAFSALAAVKPPAGRAAPAPGARRSVADVVGEFFGILDERARPGLRPVYVRDGRHLSPRPMPEAQA